MVRSLPPLFASVTVLVCVPPILMPPKGSGDGLGESLPTVAPMPVAEREAKGIAFGAVKATVMVGSPGSAGVKTTLKETLCPATNVSGRVIPVTVNSEFKPEMALIVTGDVVLLEMVSERVLVLPMTTVPKFRLPFPTPTPLALLEPPDRPWHPVSSKRAPTTKREVARVRCSRLPFNATSMCRSKFHGGGFRATGAQTRALARSVSLAAVSSHRLRKAQLGAASGPVCCGRNLPFAMNSGAKQEITTIASKLLLIHR